MLNIMPILNKSKEKTMPKSKDKSTEATVDKAAKITTKKSKKGFMFGILGIGFALVIVSIVYCIVVILLGTKGLTPKIMVAPAGIFVLVSVAVAFSKIFK